MKSLADLKIKIFADGADKAGMLSLYDNTLIKGMTTNPSLMRKAGITDYEAFAKDILQTVKDKPISLEVFTDEFEEMRKHALKISRWQQNVFVKIPISNTRTRCWATLATISGSNPNRSSSTSMPWMTSRRNTL